MEIRIEFLFFSPTFPPAYILRHIMSADGRNEFPPRQSACRASAAALLTSEAEGRFRLFKNIRHLPGE
jgi:hypothetical protein